MLIEVRKQNFSVITDLFLDLGAKAQNRSGELWEMCGGTPDFTSNETVDPCSSVP